MSVVALTQHGQFHLTNIKVDRDYLLVKLNSTPLNAYITFALSIKICEWSFRILPSLVTMTDTVNTVCKYHYVIQSEILLAINSKVRLLDWMLGLIFNFLRSLFNTIFVLQSSKTILYSHLHSHFFLSLTTRLIFWLFDTSSSTGVKWYCELLMVSSVEYLFIYWLDNSISSFEKNQVFFLCCILLLFLLSNLFLFAVICSSWILIFPGLFTVHTLPAPFADGLL